MYFLILFRGVCSASTNVVVHIVRTLMDVGSVFWLWGFGFCEVSIRDFVSFCIRARLICVDV